VYFDNEYLHNALFNCEDALFNCQKYHSAIAHYWLLAHSAYCYKRQSLMFCIALQQLTIELE